MFNLFNAKPTALLGIDLSSTSVKALHISSKEGKYTVEGYGSIGLPQNAVESGLVKDIEGVASAIKQMLVEADLSPKQVVVAVPDSSAISKVIQVNQELSESEIEEFVVMEADKYIPYPIDEINIDFTVLGVSPKNAAVLDVLIVASKAENVSNRLEVLEHAGLEVKIVDVESYAIERAAQLLTDDFPVGASQKNVAIIEIGSIYTNLFVLRGMKIIYTREEEFGGKQLIDLMVQQYGLKPNEALEKLESGQLPDDFKTRVLKPFHEMILVHIQRTLQFFFSTSQYTSVDHIALAGGVAKDETVMQLIQEATGVSVTLANLFNNVTVAPNVDRERIMRDAPSLMIACGLALREMR